MMRVRSARALRVAVAAAGLLAGAVAWAQAPATPAAPPPVPALPAGLMDPNAIRVVLSPALETTLVSQMEGRITTLRATLGGAVAKGAAVVVFDCDEPNARLRMAQAEHAAAKETQEVKTRLRSLQAAGDMEVSIAQSATKRAQAAIAVSRAQLAHCTVSAPFTGRIVKVHVKPHQGVAGGTPLVDIVSDGPLKLRLNAPSRLLRTLAIGTRFEVDIEETGKTYAAEVTAINARVDAVARTVELEASLADAPAELLPGMTGIARFEPVS